MVRLLPLELPSGKKILWKQVDAEKIEIFVDKNSARGGNAKPIVIKRFIEVNELLFEGFGLRFGDGSRIQGGKFNVFGYSNTEIEQLKNFLVFSRESLGIEPSNFNVKISLSPKDKSKIEEIKEKVSRELNIPFEKFWEPKIFDKRNLPFIDIKIQSTLLGMVVNSIFDEVKDILFSSKLFSACFLRGVIAGEANVNVRKEGRLGEISIAAEGEDRRNFLRRLLLNLGIQPNKDKTIEDQEAVCITGLSNFKIVKEWDLIKLSPNKKENFEKGMSGFKIEQSRKGELRLKVLQLLSEKSRTRQELGKLLNRSPDTIKTEALYVLERQGLVEREGIVNKARLWKITEKGLEILKDKEALEKLRSR